MKVCNHTHKTTAAQGMRRALRNLRYNLPYYVHAIVCSIKGHKTEDCSTFEADGGTYATHCVRCDGYWSKPLF